MKNLALVVTILSLGYVIGVWDHYGWVSTGMIAWLSAAIAALTYAVCVRPGNEAEKQAERSLPYAITFTLAMFAGVQMLAQAQSLIGIWFLMIAAMFSYLAASGKLTLGRCQLWIYPIVLIGFLAVGIETIRSNPDPKIDVFLVQQAGAKALAHGQNPYATTIPDIYGQRSPYYIPMVENGRTLYGYTYPAIVALVEIPSVLLTGDIRYTHLIALILASILIALARSTWIGLSAGMLLLINPFSLRMVQYAWVDSMAILFFAATLFSTRHYPRAVPYIFGLFLSSKQTMLPCIAFAPLLVGSLWELKKLAAFATKALLVVCAVYVPFYLWNPGAFLISLVTVQLHVPLRLDLISYSAYLVNKGAPVLPTWAPFLYLPVGIYVALRKAARTPAGFAAACALLLLPFFTLSKQGAPNYYYFVIGMLCCALGLAAQDKNDHATKPSLD